MPLDQTAGCAIVAIMILFVLPRRCWRYAGHLEGTLQAAPPGPPATFASCSARSVLSKDCVTTAFHAAASLLADYTDHLNIDTCGRRFACTTSLTAFLPTLPPVCMVDFASLGSLYQLNTLSCCCSPKHRQARMHTYHASTRFGIDACVWCSGQTIPQVTVARAIQANTP